MIVLTRISRVLLGTALLAGAFSAVRDEVRSAGAIAPEERARALSASEEERLREAMPVWFSAIEVLRQRTPRSSVILWWTKHEPSPQMVLDLGGTLQVVLAPRLLMPLVSAEFIESWYPRLAASGLPIYFLDLLPEIALPFPDSRPMPALPKGLELSPVIERQPQFTLRRLTRER